MSRSLKKGPYVNERILKKIKDLKQGDKTIIKVWDRACSITPEMVGFTIGVHNGKLHLPVYIRREHGQPSAGEFSPTAVSLAWRPDGEKNKPSKQRPLNNCIVTI
jgi:small subunit ribosomal protein S19